MEGCEEFQRQKVVQETSNSGGNGQPVGSGTSISSEATYGPWMIAENRNRRPRKELGRVRVEGSGVRQSRGSRFTVLDGAGLEDEYVQEARVIAAGPDLVLTTNAETMVSEEQERQVQAEGGVQSLSGRELQDVQPNVVDGRGHDPVQVVSSGGGVVPQVLPHVVSNVTGNHNAVAILDAANEKRRQRLVKSGIGLGGARKNVGDGQRSGTQWTEGSFSHSDALDPSGVVLPVSGNSMEIGNMNLGLGLNNDSGGHGNGVPSHTS
ncbi:hypothetical protein V6N13_027285 [Hibiscus sabdariffa]|uniref:Uncharacterized protein n=1 Tax=Hibiscus sabdariffa TaxID=183260 RepID=A0ABR2ASP0_9ROSI